MRYMTASDYDGCSPANHVVDGFDSRHMYIKNIRNDYPHYSFHVYRFEFFTDILQAKSLILKITCK